jgi:uncharacterized membrane protein
MATMNAATVTAALLGALSAVAAVTPARADELAGFVRCYGVSKAGQNSCASAAGAHTCAGQSSSDYSGEEWRAMRAAACTRIGGKTSPFEGTGSPKA